MGLRQIENAVRDATSPPRSCPCLSPQTASGIGQFPVQTRYDNGPTSHMTRWLSYALTALASSASDAGSSDCPGAVSDEFRSPRLKVLVAQGHSNGNFARNAALASTFFFFNDPAPPEIYSLPLHAALPI